jgi:hypothetical protein
MMREAFATPPLFSSTQTALRGLLMPSTRPLHGD